MNELIPRSYFKRISKFYFAPVWQSALTILYLLFFLYLAVFYIGNITLAIKFIGYTVINSGTLLGLSYLFWGVIFLITLIVPFSISLYAMLLLYEVWHKDWLRKEKLWGTLILIIMTIFVVVLTDEIIRLAASQDVLKDFVLNHNLNISGK